MPPVQGRSRRVTGGGEDGIRIVVVLKDKGVGWEGRGARTSC